MDAHINYVELPAPDLPGTKAFYTAAFGWEFVDYGPVYAGYQGLHVELGLNSLAVAGPAHAAGSENAVGPLVLFSTTDLAATERAVTSAGGTIVSPPYDYPGGRRFHFRDPAGNILGVYQSAGS